MEQEEDRWVPKNYSHHFWYLCIKCNKSIYFHLPKQQNHRLWSQNIIEPQTTQFWKNMFVVVNKSTRWATSVSKISCRQDSYSSVHSFYSVREIVTSFLFNGGKTHWLFWHIEKLQSFSCKGSLLQWCCNGKEAAVTLGLWAAWKEAEPGEPRGTS